MLHDRDVCAAHAFNARRTWPALAHGVRTRGRRQHRCRSNTWVKPSTLRLSRV